MSLPPMRPLPADWTPSPGRMEAWRGEFAHLVDIETSLRRFRNHYCEGQTSRNWDAKFENWMLSDAQRAADRQGTDDLGVPVTQRKKSAVPDGLQPGDEGYFDPVAYLEQHLPD